MKLRMLIVFLMFFFFCNLKTAQGYETKPVESFTVFIDPGHGGYDGGAKANGLVEKDLNLAIALYLRTYLEQAGIKVLMTRDKDIDLVTPGPGSKKKRDLDKRIEMINNSDADFFISIHMNALRDTRWSGAQTFYYESYPENKHLADCIQESLIEILQNTHRKAKSVKTLYLFKNVEKPGVLIEIGFISNPVEADNLKNPLYQQRAAFALYVGILQCVNNIQPIQLTP